MVLKTIKDRQESGNNGKTDVSFSSSSLDSGITYLIRSRVTDRPGPLECPSFEVRPAHRYCCRRIVILWINCNVTGPLWRCGGRFLDLGLSGLTYKIHQTLILIFNLSSFSSSTFIYIFLGMLAGISSITLFYFYFSNTLSIVRKLFRVWRLKSKLWI